MDTQDLKLAWSTLAQRLDQQQDLLRRVAVDRVRGRLRMQAGTAAGVLLAAILLGRLVVLAWLRSPLPPHLLLSALCMLLLAVGCAGAAARMFWLLRIDYDSPVTRVQQAVLRLRRMCIRAGWSLGVPFWILWVPLVLLAAHLRGVDLYADRPLVVWSWLAAGALGLLATCALGAWARRSGQTRLKRWLDLAFAGPYVEQARAGLEEIARFERE